MSPLSQVLGAVADERDWLTGNTGYLYDLAAAVAVKAEAETEAEAEAGNATEANKTAPHDTNAMVYDGVRAR